MSARAARAKAPLWLRTVHRVERAVGEPLEAVLHSDTYFDLVTDLVRARKSYERRVEEVSRRLLHLLNLPAGSDIRRVREQLARIERRVTELSRELEQLETDGPKRPATRQR